ncbi:hypothetical protein LSAT2_026863 [Lamellibrachia satsuma]|nr:hypothetical protein LSAT2_026863 [Lamellibrachia satsuma]
MRRHHTSTDRVTTRGSVAATAINKTSIVSGLYEQRLRLVLPLHRPSPDADRLADANAQSKFRRSISWRGPGRMPELTKANRVQAYSHWALPERCTANIPRYAHTWTSNGSVASTI